MDIHATTVAEAPLKRPALVGITCLLGVAFLTILIELSKAPQQHYYWTNIPQTINLVLVVIWVVQFLQMKRDSLFWLLSAVFLNAAIVSGDFFVPGWILSLKVSECLIFSVCYILTALAIAYNSHLVQKKVLK